MREFAYCKYFPIQALTVPLTYARHEKLSQLVLAAWLQEKYHLETERSVPRAPITPAAVSVIKLKSMIVERW